MNQIVTGNGIYSLMNHLIEALIDDGEGIVLSSPYYLGFDTMCTKRVGGRLFGVELDDLAASGCELNEDEVIEETMNRYERRIEQCKDEGIRVSLVGVFLVRINPTESLFDFLA
jgi:aspartate/methionine/tyrosine aminotransferase